MKTAIYVEDGVTQIVLTPVTAFEKEVLARLSREEVTQLRVVKGAFYTCPEGLERFGGDDQCLMLRLGESPADYGNGLSLHFESPSGGYVSMGDA